MQIRILGTGLNSYITNIKKMINSHVKEFIFIDEGARSFFMDYKNKRRVIEFKTYTTGRQNIEAFEAYGFSKKYNGVNKILINNIGDIKKIYKKAIIELHSNKKIQALRNAKLLSLSDFYSELSNKDLKIFNINQIKGEINLAKIRKSINAYEKNLINEDPEWIIQIRKALYEQINKEF